MKFDGEAAVRASLAPSAEEASLWISWQTDRSSTIRERLFSFYLPYAHKIARRHLLASAEGAIELGDLRQLGAAGLLEALDHFDPAQGAPFRAYAKRRISGSIIDGLAKMSELREQQSFHSRMRLERLGSLARGPKVADGSDWDIATLREYAVSLALGFMLEDAGLAVRDSVASPAPDAYESLAWKDIIRRLLSELRGLPTKEQTVVRRHYLDGLDFAQIATLMELSRGRISQLHRTAMDLLRKRLCGLKPFNLTR